MLQWLFLSYLQVDYSGGFETFNINRFGQKFVNRLANTKDIVLFHKRKLQAGKRGELQAKYTFVFLNHSVVSKGGHVFEISLKIQSKYDYA